MHYLNVTFNPTTPRTPQEILGLRQSEQLMAKVQAVHQDVLALDQRDQVDLNSSTGQVTLSEADVARLVGRQSATFAYPPGNKEHGIPTDPIFLAEARLDAVASPERLTARNRDDFEAHYERSYGWLGGETVCYEFREPLPNARLQVERLKQAGGRWKYESWVEERW